MVKRLIDINEEVWRKLKAKAAIDGKTISSAIEDMIKGVENE